jgi:hypothetical protein
VFRLLHSSSVVGVEASASCRSVIQRNPTVRVSIRVLSRNSGVPRNFSGEGG